MKISRACSKCIAFPICDVGFPNRGNDVCRNFHDAMESKITAHNKSVSKLLDTIEIEINRIESQHYAVPVVVMEARINILDCVSKLRDR